MSREVKSESAQRSGWISSVLVVMTLVLCVAAGFTYGLYRGAQMNIRVEPMVLTAPVESNASLCADWVHASCDTGSVAQKAYEDEQSSQSVELSDVEATLPLPREISDGVQGDEVPCDYLGSKNGSKYYPPDCSALTRINPENLVCFADPQEAIEKGYSPSKSCR